MQGEGVDADASDYAFRDYFEDIQTFEERKGVSAGHRHFGRGPFIGQSLFAVWAVVQTASADRNDLFLRLSVATAGRGWTGPRHSPGTPRFRGPC